MRTPERIDVHAEGARGIPGAPSEMVVLNEMRTHQLVPDAPRRARRIRAV